MSFPEEHKLLAGYSTGNLTKSEKQELFNAALESPELFEELVAEDRIREAFEEEGYRLQLRRELRAIVSSRKRSFLDTLRSALSWQFLTPAAVVVGALVLAIFSLYSPNGLRKPQLVVTLSPGSFPAIQMAGLVGEETPKQTEVREQLRKSTANEAAGAVLQVDRTGEPPSYHPGDAFRTGFVIDKDCAAVLIDELPDGTSARLFPNRFQSSPTVKKGERILIPPSGQGNLELSGPTGRRTLRLFVFPAGVDPFDATTDWSKISSQAHVMRQEYVVLP